MLTHRLRPIFALLAASLVGACGIIPSSSPTPEPTADRPVGPRDVVLRFDQGGGFVPIEFNLTSVPIFTLYGDGRVAYRDLQAEPLPDAGDGVTRQRPLLTAIVPKDEIEALITFALQDGGLGTARTEYTQNQVADAPSTFFDIHARGVDKRVQIDALGIDVGGGADEAARAAFGRLADRLGSYRPPRGSIVTDYAPQAFRGFLMEGFPGGPPERLWPWPNLQPSDFTAPGGDGLSVPTRILTPVDIGALGLANSVGGFLGVMLRGPDGNLYALSVRPLLPDDKP